MFEQLNDSDILAYWIASVLESHVFQGDHP